MARKQKEALVIVFDVSLQREDFTAGKDLVSQVFQRKIFSKRPDDVGVVLLGTHDTKNCLAEDDDDQYKNISVLFGMEPAKIEHLEALDKVTGTTVKGDWLSAVVVGADLIAKAREACGPKGYTGVRLVVVSDLDTQVSPTSVDTIAAAMKDLACELTFITPSRVREDDTADSQDTSSQPADPNEPSTSRGPAPGNSGQPARKKPCLLTPRQKASISCLLEMERGQDLDVFFHTFDALGPILSYYEAPKSMH